MDNQTEQFLGQYARRLKHDLDQFTDGAGLWHSVRMHSAGDLVFCTVGFLETPTAPVEMVEGAALSSLEEMAKDKANFGAWVLTDLIGACIAKERLFLRWAIPSAKMDATDLIGAILSPTSNPLSIAILRH